MDKTIKMRQGEVELIASEQILISGIEPVHFELSADDGPPLKVVLCFDKKKETQDGNWTPDIAITDHGYEIQVAHLTDGGNTKYWPIGTTDRGDEEVLLMLHVEQLYEPEVEVRKILMSLYKRKMDVEKNEPTTEVSSESKK